MVVVGCSVGVKPELDPVGVAQPDQHGAAAVTGDEAAVLLADGGQMVGLARTSLTGIFT
jgi:hypothetical protein